MMPRRPWFDWGLLLLALFLGLALLWFFGARVLLRAYLPLLGLFTLLLLLLLLGQGGGWLAGFWATPLLFRAHRYGLLLLAPLLLLHLAFALGREEGPAYLGLLLAAQPWFAASVVMLLLYCGLTVCWSGAIYPYNPLVLQCSRLCLYVSELLLAEQLFLLGARWPLWLLASLPLLSRLLLWCSRKPYRLLQIEEGGDRVRLLTLAPFGRALAYQPGQYAYLSFPLNFPRPLRGEFPLSFASAPAQNPRFLVRLQDNDPIPPGSIFYLRSVQGSFFYRFDSYPRVLLLAAGLGVSPYLSLLEQLRLRGTQLPLELHWFVREEDAALLQEQLQQYQAELTSLRVFRYTALTRPQILAVVEELLSTPDRESGIYFCGSVGFNRVVRQAALAREWPPLLLNYQFI